MNYKTNVYAGLNIILLLLLSSCGGGSGSDNTSPKILSEPAQILFENNTDLSVVAEDAENQVLSYDVTGGVDQRFFEINSSTGTLIFIGNHDNFRFKDAPDYENPLDENQDSIYEVQVEVSDGQLSDTILLNVEIVDVIEQLQNPFDANPGTFSFPSYDTPGDALDVDISGNYAYIADKESGLQIIDISNPDVPVYLSSYDTPGEAKGVQVVGNYAYISDSFISGLLIIDISDPVNPSLAGSYSDAHTGLTRGLFVTDNIVYLTTPNYGLVVIDVSDPNSPQLLDSIETCDANNVHVAGGFAYIADSSCGLQIIDVRDPTNLSLSGSYNPRNLFIYNVVVFEDFAYVTDSYYGLHKINVSDPSTPYLTKVYHDLTDHSALGLEIADGIAYLAVIGSYDQSRQGWEIYLQAVDLSETGEASSFANFYYTEQLSFPVNSYSLAIDNGRVYMTAGSSGVHIIDVSNSISTNKYDTAFRNELLTYQIMWEGDPFPNSENSYDDFECVVTAGNCNVVAVDYQTRTATANWLMSADVGDYQIMINVGNNAAFLSAIDTVTVTE